MSGELPDISQFISDGPTALLITLLLSALIGAYRGWWVPSYLYQELRRDVDSQSEVNEKMVVILTELTNEIHERRIRLNATSEKDRPVG